VGVSVGPGVGVALGEAVGAVVMAIVGVAASELVGGTGAPQAPTNRASTTKKTKLGFRFIITLRSPQNISPINSAIIAEVR